MGQSVELASAETENRLLSCLITSNMGPTNALALGLARDDFAWEVDALIYDAVVRIAERGHSIDTTVLAEELASSNHLDAIGGTAVIDQLAAVPHDPNLITQYVEIVRDRAMRRRVMAGFEQSAQVLLSEPDGKKAVERVQQTMFRAFDRYMHSAFNGIDAEGLRAAWDVSEGEQEYMLPPYEFMVDEIYGYARGTLTIWGGYPGDGKSIIGLRTFIENAAAGKKVAMLSLEMTQHQMTVRMLSYLTGISTDRIEQKDISDDEVIALESAWDTIETWDIEIYCDPSMTVEDLRAIQMRERYDVIVIDYLQRFDFVTWDQVPRMARQLKNLALSTMCAIVLLSQVNPKETKPGANPFTIPDNLSLYGGRATGHEADNIFFIWGDRDKNEYGGWDRNGYGLLLCTKVRQGHDEWRRSMVFIPSRVTWEPEQ